MYKIKKILNAEEIKFPDGGAATKTQVLTEDDEAFWTWKKDPKVGDELEGTIEKDKFGNPVLKMERKGFGGGFRGNGQSDPNTMLISYAKDIVVAMISAGILKKPEEIAKQLGSFTQFEFTMFDKRKSGGSLMKKKTEEKEKSEEEPKSEEKEQVKEEDAEEINLDDIPF